MGGTQATLKSLLLTELAFKLITLSYREAKYIVYQTRIQIAECFHITLLRFTNFKNTLLYSHLTVHLTWFCHPSLGRFYWQVLRFASAVVLVSLGML